MKFASTWPVRKAVTSVEALIAISIFPPQLNFLLQFLRRKSLDLSSLEPVKASSTSSRGSTCFLVMSLDRALELFRRTNSQDRATQSSVNLLCPVGR